MQGLGVIKGSFEVAAVGEDFVGEVNQVIDFEVAAFVGRGTSGWMVFEGTHGAGAGVAEPFDGGSRVGCAVLFFEPTVDNLFAKFVWEGISDETGKTLKGIGASEFGEGKDFFGEGHHEGSYVQVGSEESRFVFKEGGGTGGVEGDRTEGLTPELDGGGSHVDELLGGLGFVADALRLGFLEFDLLKGTDEVFGEEGIDAVEELQGAADPEEGGEAGGGFARFEALEGTETEARLFGELVLGEFAVDALAGESLADFGQDGVVSKEFPVHSVSNMAFFC